MKIRIKDNTVRFRLNKLEVEEFGKTGNIEGRTEFSPIPFVYALQTSPSAKELTASFQNNTLSLVVPATWAKEWVNSNRIGFDGKVTDENGKHIYLLLEKDFKCLDNTLEDQVDNYENPLTIQL
jgi:hypothetical protein